MNLKEYASFDATGLAQLVRKKEISPMELLDISLAAIDQVNGKLNAVVDDTRDYALQQIRAGIDLSAPFCGVPLAIKDCGGFSSQIRATVGTRLSGDGVYAAKDATLLQRFKRAGALIVATSTTSEFCIDSSTETLRHGATHNPWHLDYSVGGSSGGAAALVASGALPFAHGSDGGGSIRIPASMCGIIGFKPSRFRVPVGPVSWDPGVVAHFALTRSVRDAAALLDAVEGPDPGYYGTFAPDAQRHLQAIQQPPRKLRIAYMLHTPYGTPFYDEECITAVLRTVEVLRALGHECEEAYPEISPAYQEARIHSMCDSIAITLENMAKETGLPIDETTVEPLVYKTYLQSRRRTGLDVFRSQAEMAKAARSVGQFFCNYDILLSPTMGRIERRLGTLNGVVNAEISAEEWARRRQDYACITPLANIAGLPSVSLPLYRNQHGMPLGIELDSAVDNDQLVLQLAAQLEKTELWITEKPAIYVK